METHVETLEDALEEARQAVREIRYADPQSEMLKESYWIERGNSDTTPEDDVAFAQAMYFAVNSEPAKKSRRRRRIRQGHTTQKN